jgi:aminopeptidase-like protein
MSEKEKKALTDEKYRIFIDSELFDGFLTYADCIFEGKIKDEIVISTYCCHPQMANDNCSGMVLLAELAKYVKNLKNKYYSYRFVLYPETIGAIVYLSQENRLDYMKRYTLGGYTFSCVGDDGNYSVILSKDGNSLSDRALENVLFFSEKAHDRYKVYSYLERGSDERQYNSPGVEIPVTGYCRTKYWEFPEYHTSMDTMDYISPKGLQGSIDVMKDVIDLLECNRRYRIITPCEPQLGKRGLYPTVSKKGIYDDIKAMMDFIAYADGKKDLIQISNEIHQPVKVLIPIVKKLLSEGLISMED